MDDKKEETARTPLTAITTTDEEAITTSTESDLFDSWTLVTDKQTKNAAETARKLAKNKTDNTKDKDEQQTIVDDDNRIEELPPDDKQVEHKELQAQKETHNDSNLDDNELTTDELSDGISIISESDKDGSNSSTEEHLTAHPYLQKHLSSLGLSLQHDDALHDLLKTPPNTPAELAVSSVSPLDNNYEQSQIRQRLRKRSKTPAGASGSDKQKQLVNSVSVCMQLPSNALFYFKIGLTLLLLLFLAKQLPDLSTYFNNVNGKPNAEQLERKISDMELQNNLLRAEIDILSKQVNYLSNQKQQQQQQNAEDLKPPQQQQQQKWQRKDKTFKAWSGNGDTLQPEHITKADLKQAYKCADGRFVQVAGMCVEKSAMDANTDTLVDEIGNAVNEALHSTETFKNFEKVLEQLQAFNSEEQQPEQPTVNNNNLNAKYQESFNKRLHDAVNKYQQPQRHSAEAQRQSTYETIRVDEAQSDEESKENAWHKRSSKENFKKTSKEHSNEQESTKQWHSRERRDKDNDSKERFNKQKQQRFNNDAKQQYKDNSKERKQYFGNDSKEHSKERFRQHSKEHSKENSKESKERFNSHSGEQRFKQNFKENSKEHFNNDFKEKFKRQKAATQRFDKYDSKEQNYNKNKYNAQRDGSGEWHTKLMQQRENARRQNEEMQRKNWFIERSNAREQMRL